MSTETDDRALVAAWNSGVPVEQIAEARGVLPRSVPQAVRRASRRCGVGLSRPRAPLGGVVPAAEDRWFERVNPGRCRAAVELALLGADLAGSRRITAELVRDVADLCDSARERQDPKLWLAASRQLGSLLGQLGLVTPAAASPESDPDEIGDALGSGPE